MTYDDLRSQFQGLLNRRDLTTSLRDTFIQQSITRTQRELRVPAMEKGVVATISTYDGGILVPNDLIELKELVSSDGFVLQRRDLQTTLQAEKLTGLPRIYARQGGRFRLGPSPVSGDTIRLNYYAETSALVNSTDENTLSVIAGDLIVYGALSYAADYFLDDRASAFEGRYQSIKGELTDQAQRDELSGMSAVSPAYSFDCDD